MAKSSGGKRPLSFYLHLLIIADGLIIAFLILLGGVDLQAGPLHFRVHDLAGPVLLLLGLLVVQRLLAGKKKEGTWQDAFFGPAGSPTERWRAVEVLVLLSTAYVLFVGGAAVARYRSLGAESLNLAMAAQAAWNTVDGRILSSSLAGEGGYLGAFFSPVMAVIAQGYRFWPTPEFLVRVQSIVLALGVWPVYLMARRDLGCRRWALVPAALYILLPAVRGMNLAGFHPLTLAVTPLLFAFYLLREKAGWWGYFFVAVALACGEEAWPAVALLGLYICLPRRRWREGLFLLLLGSYGYLFLVSFGMPKFGGDGGGVAKAAMGALFAAPGAALALMDDPSYLRDLFLPLALLPLMGPLVLAFGLPLLAVCVLGQFPAGYTGRAAQTAVFLPFLLAAVVAGLRRLKEGKILGRLNLTARPPLRWALVILPLLFFGESPAVHFRDTVPEGYRESLTAAAELIPAEASLSTGERLAVRFAHRESLHALPATGGADWILVEANNADKTDKYIEIHNITHELVSGSGYGLVYRDEFFTLLAFGQGDRTPATLNSLR
jgi:uncharacterized membrane protein